MLIYKNFLLLNYNQFLIIWKKRGKAVDNDVVKKKVFNSLRFTVFRLDNNISSTSMFIHKTQDDADKQDWEKILTMLAKVADTSVLVRFIKAQKLQKLKLEYLILVDWLKKLRMTQ